MSEAQAEAFLHGAVPERINLPDVGGRPSDYNPAIAEKICERLASGISVRTLENEEGFPHRSTIHRWCRDHEEFRLAYALAKECYAEALLDEAVEVARTRDRDLEVSIVPPDEAEGGEGFKITIRKDVIARDKLIVGTLFKRAAQIEAKKAGSPAANGDDAKVIDGQVVPGAEHPMHPAVLAWDRVLAKHGVKP